MQVQPDIYLLKSIFHRCEPIALAKSAIVCKLWKAMISDEEFNKHLLERDFPRMKMCLWDFKGTSYQIYQSFQRIHWNLRRKHFQPSSSAYPIPFNDCAITPDGKHLLEFYSTMKYSTFTVSLDFDRNNQICFRGSEAPIVAVSILNNERAISASTDRVMKMWDLVSGQCLQTLETDAEIVDLQVVHKKGIFLTASRDGKISQWSNQFKLLKVIDTGILSLSSIALSLDEDILVLSAASGEHPHSSSLQFRDFHDMTVLQTIDFPEGIPTLQSAIHRVRISDDGSKVMLCSANSMSFSLDFLPK